MICGVCKKPVTRSQAAIDHIVPLSKGGKNIEMNMRTRHIKCNKMKRRLWRRVMRKIGYWQWKFIMWLDSWQMCPKEAMGYRCKHRPGECGK